MKKALLVMFVGVPGSGKTTFARQLGARLNAVVLNSDSIRMSMWGSLEAIQSTHKNPEDRTLGNRLTFGAMNYAANQILQTGISVIYDCNANHRSERDEKHEIAKVNDAITIIVRIRVPYELSLQRIKQREVAHDQRQISPDRAKEVLDRFVDEIEEPGEDERMVEISGEMPFDEQYKIFMQALILTAR